METEQGGERERLSGRGRRREVAVAKKKNTRRTNNTSLKRLILIYAVTDGERRRYILKTQTRMKMKVSACTASVKCKAPPKTRGKK